MAQSYTPMRMIRAAVSSLAALATLLAFSNVSALAITNEAEVYSFEQRDLDGDSDPDVATILADYFGVRYRVVVYDQGTDMKWSEAWQTGTDFVSDVWLFHTALDEATKLVIRFSRGPDGYLAELYDDVDGDGHVAYSFHGVTGIEVRESAYPTMRITAEQPWLLPDGRVNYMVNCTTLRSWPIPFMQAGALSYLPKDGEASYSHEVVDSDGNGVPDYELKRAFPELPGDWSVFRSAINANVSQTPMPDFEGSFFWPYLGYAHPDDWSIADLGRPPGDLTPPIHIDWQDGRMKGIGAFLPAYGIGDQWVVLSSTSIEKGKVNDLDWEVFAYYDFTSDSMMDMLLRLIYQPVEPVRVGSTDLHFQQVSYAWHHQHRDTMEWDYELELAALHELPSTVVDFKDFALYMVPYEELLEHFSLPSDWAYATFVAAESNTYRSNEGIWEWGTLEGIQTDVGAPVQERSVPGAVTAQYSYLRGWEEDSPANLYRQIREGFRGEYADLMGPASLYFSAVDHRLHLSGAQKGLWNLGNDREIQYRNLGGAYLDTWILLEHGETTKVLYAPPGHLIYQDVTGVQIFQADGPAALFATVPPRNHVEWQELDDRLGQYGADFAPDDFLAMAEQFGEPQAAILNAAVRDLRLTDEGLRFVLTLGADFAVVDQDPLRLDMLAPGDYAVLLSEETPCVQPLRSARPKIIPGTFELSSVAPMALQPVSVKAVFQNSSLEDVYDLWVRASVEEPGVPARILGDTRVDLLAGQSVPLTFGWTPAVPGQSQIHLFWWGGAGEKPQASNAATASQDVWVQALPQADAGQIWRVSNVRAFLPLSLLLVCVSLTAAGLTVAWLRPTRNG